jgi:hypothetical protein
MAVKLETVSSNILTARTKLGALLNLIPGKDTDKHVLVEEADEALQKALGLIQSIRCEVQGHVEDL